MNADKRIERIVNIIKLYEKNISSNKEWINTHRSSSLKDEISKAKINIKFFKSIVRSLKWAVGKKYYR